METFGDWLQGELDKRGMKQADLARESGLTTATISRLITQQRGPDDATCLKISKALGIPVEDVFRRAGKLPPQSELEHDPTLREIYEVVKQLTEEQRAAVLEFVWFERRREREKKSSARRGDPNEGKSEAGKVTR